MVESDLELLPAAPIIIREALGILATPGLLELVLLLGQSVDPLHDVVVIHGLHLRLSMSFGVPRPGFGRSAHPEGNRPTHDYHLFAADSLDDLRIQAHDGDMAMLKSSEQDEWRPDRPAGSDAAKERQSREELRELILATAREILAEEGIQTASSSLTFKRVFARVERQTGRSVTNASVIRRIWDNMADFQADVLVSIAQDDQRPELSHTLGGVGRVLEASDLSTVASRRQALQELCRVGGEMSVNVTSDSLLWSAWISVLAIATTAPDSDQRERMIGGLLRGFDSVAGFWEGTFSRMFGYLGFRVREPRTLRQFTEAVVAWSEGQTIRQRVSGQASRLSLPTGPDGGLQEWTLFGVGLEALTLQFFEPDPDFVPPPPTAAPR